MAFSGYKARERKASRRKGEDELRTKRRKTRGLRANRDNQRTNEENEENRENPRTEHSR